MNKSRRMDLIVGYILFGGVLLSAIFLIAGMVWRWANTGNPTLQYAISGTNLLEFWVSDIRQFTAGQFRPRLLVNVGIALLLLTPFLRVAVSTLYFALVERNRKYTVITGIVLLILSYSLFLR